MSMGFNNTARGMFTISWEIKDADGISVAIEIPEGTMRLPYEYRKRIVQRLREKLLPPKAEGDYVVVYGLPKTEDQRSSSMKIMWWDGLDFVNKQSHVAQLAGMNIYRWVRLPEV